MLYLPALISTITKMIIQNAKIMGTGLFTKIIGTGLRLLNDKYIMPLLIKFFRVFILRLAGLWPNILYYDKRYFKKIIDKAFPGLKILGQKTPKAEDVKGKGKAEPEAEPTLEVDNISIDSDTSQSIPQGENTARGQVSKGRSKRKNL